MQTRLSRSESRRMRPDLESSIEHLPGLASLALWCRFADADDDEEAVAYTDGKTIYAGARYEKFNAKERRFVCLHEILHVALCHPQRAEQLKRRDVDFNAELLNIAADAIINSSLENLTGLETPAGAWTLLKIWQVLDENITDKEKAANAATSSSAASSVITLHCSYGSQSESKKIANLTRAEFTCAGRWSCEELYYFLKAQAQHRANFLAYLVAAYGKDSLGGDLRRETGIIGEQTNLTARTTKVTTNETDTANEKREWQQRLALLRGTVPELFQRLAGELPKTETPWEQILRSVVQTVFQETTVTDYSRPSRRWLAMERDYSTLAGVNLPFAPAVRKKRGTRLAVALDTSGSIDGELLGRFLAEIGALVAYNQRNLILIIGDAAVHQIAEIDWRDVSDELARIKYTGGGGTDFRPLIEAAKDFEPDALVYLTDLYGETGDEPDFPVIWATHGIAGDAPWGEQIKLK
jgi:predicted metal-dependent peptidase